MKSKGPKILPCGTPYCICLVFESVPSVETNCILLWRYEVRPRDTLDIALWRKKDACLSSKDAFLRKNILKNPSRERASFDSLLASFGVSLNAKRCALNRKLES